MVKRPVLVVGLAAALGLAASAALSRGTTHPTAASHEAAARAGALETQEEDQVTGERLDALARARARGAFGGPVTPTIRPAPGWIGSRLLNLNVQR